jgi:ribose/xylose/arabinose/galactoside ABC-type transport system permease subunit
MALSICGAITVLVARLFGSFKQLAPGQANWSAFSGVLLAVGILAIIVSLVPASFIRKVRPGFTDERRFSIVFLVAFAAVGFAAAVSFALVPVTLSPSMTAVYSVCPACVTTATVDPSLATVVFLLAPVNAAVFGAFGGVIGALLQVIRD